MQTTESKVTEVVPYLLVRDMERSIRFYVDGLGFTIAIRWEPDGKLRWCSLRLGDAAIMLQEFGREDPRRNAAEGSLGIGVSIYFICTDALDLYRQFTSRGLQPKTPFVGNGMWVTPLADPDGYMLFFESRTDAPEESVYEG